MKDTDQPASNPSAKPSAEQREMDNSRIIDIFGNPLRFCEYRSKGCCCGHSDEPCITNPDTPTCRIWPISLEKAIEQLKAELGKYKLATEALQNCVELDQRQIRKLQASSAYCAKGEGICYPLDDRNNEILAGKRSIEEKDQQIAALEYFGEIIIQQRDEDYQAFDNLMILATTFAANMPANLIEKLRAFSRDKGDFGSLMDILLPKVIENPANQEPTEEGE